MILGEQEVVDPDELLLRQIHPSQIDDGKVRSSTFMPSVKDDGKLSTSRSSRVTATQAFDHHVTVLKLKSAGVYAISVAELLGEGLRAIDDSAVAWNSELPPGHTYVDFRLVPSDKKARKIASRLRDKAVVRGWQHLPGAG